MRAFRIKEGDTWPPLRAQLTTGRGKGAAAIDLTNADFVQWIMRSDCGGEVVNAPCTIEDPLAGQVSYAWQAGDTKRAGTYIGEFEITWRDGSIQTVPNDEDYVVVDVSPQLGSRP
jgi:hypothetical protein